jgi:Histidine kinase-, DNA gyrase B-, and HSP90-like ATPase
MEEYTENTRPRTFRDLTTLAMGIRWSRCSGDSAQVCSVSAYHSCLNPTSRTLSGVTRLIGLTRRRPDVTRLTPHDIPDLESVISTAELKRRPSRSGLCGREPRPGRVGAGDGGLTQRHSVEASGSYRRCACSQHWWQIHQRLERGRFQRCRSDEQRELRIGTGKDASGGVLVAVRDSGPGPSPESFDRLFDAFYTTKPGGMDMGLSICCSIVEAHGGRIWASPDVGPGRNLSFALPLPSAPPA